MTQTLRRSGRIITSAALFSCLCLGSQSASAQQPYPSPPPGQPAFGVSADASVGGAPCAAGTPGCAPAPGAYPPGAVQPYPQPGQPTYAPPYQPPPPGYPYAQPYPYGAVPAKPQPVLKGYEVKRPHWPLLGAGIGILGGSYLLTAGITGAIQATDCAVNTTQSSCTTSGTYWPMYIPVVGPFIEIGYLSGSSWGVLAYPGLVFTGLVQTAGMALIIAGAIVPRKVAVYDEPRLSIAPYTLPAGGGGLMASGRF
jgi:hypothetical protein